MSSITSSLFDLGIRNDATIAAFYHRFDVPTISTNELVFQLAIFSRFLPLVILHNLFNFAMNTASRHLLSTIFAFFWQIKAHHFVEIWLVFVCTITAFIIASNRFLLFKFFLAIVTADHPVFLVECSFFVYRELKLSNLLTKVTNDGNLVS